MSTNDSRLGSQLFQTIAKPFKNVPYAASGRGPSTYLIVKMWSDLGAKELPIPILPPLAQHEDSSVTVCPTFEF